MNNLFRFLPIALITVIGNFSIYAAEATPSPSPSPTTPQPSPSPTLAVTNAVPPSTIPSDSNFARNYVRQSFLEDHMAANKPENIDLIFIGDSITEQWRWGNGRPVWEKFYAGRAIDFGVSGDRTQHVLWRLDKLPIGKFHPKVAVILIGTNNCEPESTPETIAAGVKAVIAKTKQVFPGIRIVLVSILPNARANDKMVAANTLIKDFADGDSVIWFDLASKFTPQGDNWKGLQKDKLHLSTEGYQIWADELNPVLEKNAPKQK
jgi:lysophospholipase L1-like esterase